MLRTTLLWASQNRALAQRIPHYRFARKAVTRFMPGETVEDALRASDALRTQSILGVVSRLGENVTEAQEAIDVRSHYVDVLQARAGAGVTTHISVKPTQLGLDIDPELCADNLAALAEEADRSNGFVWVDMESSAYVDRTIALFNRARAEHTSIGICLQAYLYRTPQDLEALLESTTAIRLVKGAYREDSSVAIASKKDVDAVFMRLASRLLEEAATGREVGAPPGLATHDLDLLGRLTGTASHLGIPTDAFEIQMLYGIQRDAQARYAREGYRVRVLISYGTAWFAWYMRRLAERPANVLFLLKNLMG
ncbi:MAG: proline dehydrogenase family protein [Longimicrobiales bacterium]